MREFVPIIWLVLGIGALVWLQFNPLISESERDYQGKNLIVGRQLSLACRGYALDHEGATPRSLEALYASDYVPEVELGRFDYFDPESKTRMPWMYFPQQGILEEDSKDLLFVSPKPYRGKRVLVFTDTSSEVMKESECQELLKKWR